MGKTGTETNATITLDQTRPWSDNPSRLITQYSVEHVLLHEFGHITGLNHTDCNDQVMFLYTYPGPTRVELGDGDIAGEQSIYGN